MKATKYAHEWRPSKDQLKRIQATLDTAPGGVPRSEYPRPQFRRPDWICLNGRWEFSLDQYGIGQDEDWHLKKLPDALVVPFAPQTTLSGKHETGINEVVWYARGFEIPDGWRQDGKNVLLHFGAVDYRCTVWVNGREVGHNVGGHVPFWFDVTPYLDAENNRICLRVEDKQSLYQPRGKQAISGKPSGIDYFCTTGIWQSVWLESVPSLRIQSVVLDSIVGKDAAHDALEATITLHAPAVGWHVVMEVLANDDDESPVVAGVQNDAAGAALTLRAPLPEAKRWSPDAPHLYGLRFSLLKNGQKFDEVRSYAGLRTIALRDGKFLLNGEALYLKMVLDQGYWPDGGMTAPSDEALRADVEWIKEFGFNGARKHQKMEDPRWLFWCDRLGLLVWGEMANARGWKAETEEVFLNEWERAVRRDLNHPCIITWVPLNESWGVPKVAHHPGQYSFVERAVALTRRLDGTRPVVDNDGWEHTDHTDIVAIHDYKTGQELLDRYAGTLRGEGLPTHSWNIGSKKGPPTFARGAKYQGQPIMLTEVGGFLNIPNIPKSQWDALYKCYGAARSPEELLAKYRELMESIAALPFVAGFCYTQLCDIEQEINGLMLYDRTPKIAPEKVAQIHRELFGF